MNWFTLSILELELVSHMRWLIRFSHFCLPGKPEACPPKLIKAVQQHFSTFVK